ncbi:hypothetical protein BYT27DRAFT_7112693, partial [Phlegmacium glaucopus]
QAGCETQWYHLLCVNLEQIPWNWVCDACNASGMGLNDVIFLYLDMCLIS